MSNDLHLDDAANTFDIPAGDVDAVVSRARTRTQRRRALLATVTTIAVVASAAAFIGTRGEDGDGGNTNIAAEIGGNAKLGEDQFTWTRRDDAKGLAWSPAVAGSSQLYALSTGPGERDLGMARQNGYLYRSADGVDWQSVSRFGNDMFLSDLAPSSERLYAVGTGPATAAVQGSATKATDLIAGWSDDGGEHWSKAVLPFDMKAVAAKSIRTSVMDTEIATSPKGTLAIASIRATLDVPALLPAGATAPNGWATTADGVDVLGPKRDNLCPAGTTDQKSNDNESAKPSEVGPTYCFNANAPDRQSTTVTPQEAHGVTASYTWAQLGVSGDVRRAARGDLVAFFAEPGSTSFERIDLADMQVGAPLLAIAAEDGFDIVNASAPSFTNETSHMSVLHSADGRSFAPMASDPSLAYAYYAGLLGNTPVVLGGTQDGSPMMLRRIGDAWTTTDLASLVSRPANTEVYLGPSGVGPAGLAVSVMIAEVDTTRDGAKEQRGVPVAYLLTSRDGVSWHGQTLDELAGRKTGGVNMVAVTPDHHILSPLLPKTDPNAEDTPRNTLVCTPR
jgi:hypothetical protein